MSTIRLFVNFTLVKFHSTFLKIIVCILLYLEFVTGALDLGTK